MERGSFGRVVIGGVVAALVLSGCQLKGGGEDLVNGKTLFVQECAACHVLKRAGATGVTGPDLDAAFAQSRRDGLGESTFRGVVEQQILHPNINQQVDPKDGKTRLPLMPAKLVEGDDARDVAAYVAQAVAKEGDDPGRLAAVGASQAEGTAEAENGTLDIPVAAAGLAYQFADAKAPAGEVRVTSENPQSRPARHRGRGQRRQREGRGRPGRRHVGVLGQPAARRVHVLLLRARPPRGWHGRQAHRRVGRTASTEEGGVPRVRCRLR